MYYRARYYAPQWGRFLSEDPLGVDVGINPFVYGNNNPVNATDPSGNDWLDTASDFFGGWGDTLSVRLNREGYLMVAERPWRAGAGSRFGAGPAPRTASGGPIPGVRPPRCQTLGLSIYRRKSGPLALVPRCPPHSKVAFDNRIALAQPAELALAERGGDRRL